MANILANIPGTSDNDSLSYRIEALRYFLEKEIGAEPFLNTYRHIQVTKTLLKNLSSQELDEEKESKEDIYSLIGPKN